MAAIMLVGCSTKDSTSDDKSTENTITVKDVKERLKYQQSPKE